MYDILVFYVWGLRPNVPWQQNLKTYNLKGTVYIKGDILIDPKHTVQT